MLLQYSANRITSYVELPLLPKPVVSGMKSFDRCFDECKILDQQIGRIAFFVGRLCIAIEEKQEQRNNGGVD